MPTNIVVPQMGESIVDARVAKWLKNEGDAVTVGEPLVELETDKVDVEVSAPQAGVLSKIAHNKGDDVKIGEVLGVIEVGISGTSGTAEPASPKRESAKAGATPSAPGLPSRSAERSSEAAATPSARRLAREQNVPISDVKPTGPRVTKSDVEQQLVSPKPVKGGPVWTKPSYGEVGRTEERVRMSKRRATIARRLIEAQQTAAMLTTFNEIEMSAVTTLRDRQKQSFEDRYGVGLGIASFFVKASIAAL